jgi:hypothetical protein
MSKAQKVPDCSDVISKESEALKKRREILFGESAADFDHTRFGIALSGGGIRSASINLGFLRTLNEIGLLKRADYLSTVSGGGYTGAYLHATIKAIGSEVALSDRNPKAQDCYDQLFSKKHIDHLRSRGEYLIPGKGFKKSFNRLVLVIGYLSSLIMSLVSPALLVLLAYSVYGIFSIFIDLNSSRFEEHLTNILVPVGLAAGGVLVIHYLLNRIKIYGLNTSLWFHRAETGILIASGLIVLALVVYALDIRYTGDGSALLTYFGIGLAAIIAGYVTNPNASSFHRFYRGQLSEAFLKFAGKGNHRNILLKDLFVVPDMENTAKKEAVKFHDYLNPYPLINTCLNLQAAEDPKFQGTKTNDYFLLSPFYCGAKLTKYVATGDHPGYRSMTLPAATTISAAALNPGMGIYSNKVRSIFLALFNARLGYWTWNPMKQFKHIMGLPVVWWPTYFFNELISNIGTDKKMLNISDGGHIENLAVYELLRRKCRLIIAVDAGEDARYEFSDLENLTIRSRNELGIEIRFFEGQDPEDIIRPKASFGYSRKRFAVAGLYKIWEEFDLDTGGYSTGDNLKTEVLVNYNHGFNAAEVPFEVYIKNEQNPDKELLEKAEAQAWERYLRENPDSAGMEKLRIGTFIYVKSSVTAPVGKPNIAPPKEEKKSGLLQQLTRLWQKKPQKEKDTESLKYAIYKYKIYHPAFPHEPTSDQFFDEVQWEAYYQLGQHIAADVLEGCAAYSSKKPESPDVRLSELIAHFEHAVPPVPMPEAVVKLPEVAVRGLDQAEEIPKAAEQVDGPLKEGDDYYKI